MEPAGSGGALTQQAPVRSKPWRPATLGQGWDVRTQASSGRRSLDGNQLRCQWPKHGTPEERRVPRSSPAGQGSSAEDKVRTKLNEVWFLFHLSHRARRVHESVLPILSGVGMGLVRGERSARLSVEKP